MDATPSVSLPAGAGSGVVQGPPASTEIGDRKFIWGSRTFVIGVINVTSDSFSGDGLLKRGADPVAAAVRQAKKMAVEGADIVDVGGESTRPGHTEVAEKHELARVEPVVRAIRAALPGMPISIDTTKPGVAEAALAAGANLLNDIWGTAPSDDLAQLAAAHAVPMVLMHNRDAAVYRNVVTEVLADLSNALERAVRAGVDWEKLIVDPGIGFGKTAEQNLELLRNLSLFARLGRPVLIGTSRKSTIGKVLDLPANERLEGTLATTALAVAAGVDMVRVHDVQANVRVARMADAIIRGGWTEEAGQ
jgi:dihydropteroate synthase